MGTIEIRVSSVMGSVSKTRWASWSVINQVQSRPTVWWPTAHGKDFRVYFNGTGGRLEMDVLEESYVNAGGEPAKEGAVAHTKITVHPMLAPPYEVPVVEGEGGHAGGDTVLLNDLFGTPVPDRLHRAESHVDGAMSILTGTAANKAIRTGQVVQVKDLVQF